MGFSNGVGLPLDWWHCRITSDR